MSSMSAKRERVVVNENSVLRSPAFAAKNADIMARSPRPSDKIPRTPLSSRTTMTPRRIISKSTSQIPSNSGFVPFDLENGDVFLAPKIPATPTRFPKTPVLGKTPKRMIVDENSVGVSGNLRKGEFKKEVKPVEGGGDFDSDDYDTCTYNFAKNEIDVFDSNFGPDPEICSDDGSGVFDTFPHKYQSIWNAKPAKKCARPPKHVDTDSDDDEKVDSVRKMPRVTWKPIVEEDEDLMADFAVNDDCLMA